MAHGMGQCPLEPEFAAVSKPLAHELSAVVTVAKTDLERWVEAKDQAIFCEPLVK